VESTLGDAIGAAVAEERKKNMEKYSSVISDMEAAGFVLVTPDNTEHNHVHELSHWLSNEFLLFRGSVCVDNYVALDLTWRGDGQFLAFSKVRESDSNSYIEHRESSYYLTLKETAVILKAMRAIQDINHAR
jgi:hypothetical protein